MRFLVFIIFYCGFYIFEANAKDYSGLGEYRFGPNTAESIACDLALVKAKKNALSNAFGEKIFSEDLMRCSEADNAECELNKITFSTINGTIKKIKKKERKLQRLEGASICRYLIVAEIVKPKKQKDPNFHFNIELNKKIFRDGEKFIIHIVPSTKMFVYIFQWNPYKSEGINLTKIFPNKYETNNEIENKKIIPEKKYNYSFVVEYPHEIKDKKYIDEYLLILSTKTNTNLLDEYAFKKLQERIVEIPNNEYRIEKINYEILKN